MTIEEYFNEIDHLYNGAPNNLKWAEKFKNKHRNDYYDYLPSLESDKILDYLITYLLGPNYRLESSMPNDQANFQALLDIINRYRRFKS